MKHHDLRKRLDSVTGADRFFFLRQIRRLEKKGIGPGNPGYSELDEKIGQSAERRKTRQEQIPRLTYPVELPITSRREEIVRMIKDNQVTILSGETGSGKSTQIPKFCLEAGRGIDGKIGVTQPRRIAAVTIASRIAEELGEGLGKSVGYKIRFQEEGTRDEYIKVMTDGILLAETQGDRFLNEYDTIIVDEAHERSLNIDFILGILKGLLAKRKDLKLIVTSATLDTVKFSRAFGDAPVIEVSGRTYPVEVRYRPPSREELENNSLAELAVSGVKEIEAESGKGDILIFMPTEQDIRETCELLEGRRRLVLPLFSRLQGNQQRKVFLPSAERKIVVATNVAETSVTIPGIKYVIDTGLARILQYSPLTRTTSLPVKGISKSSADQRKGRCGRVMNGVCIRLYGREDYESRLLFTPPEILRENLAEVILRMMSLRLGDPEKFPFIDPPQIRSIRDAYTSLVQLGALQGDKKTGGYRLTPEGRRMARFPLDPGISKMLLTGADFNCVDSVLVIASALSIQDPRERPAEKEKEADAAHALFAHPDSDFISYLSLWNNYHKALSQSNSAARKFCRTRFVNYRRMREFTDIHSQLSRMLSEEGIPVIKRKDPSVKIPGGTDDPEYGAVHKAVTAAFIANIARKKDRNIYRAAKGREAMIFPGSGLFDGAGKGDSSGKEWIVAAEMVKTSRLFARTAAVILPEWIIETAGHIVNFTYTDPRWERKIGRVTATRKASVFGFPLGGGETVPYGAVNSREASEVFIRQALVEGDAENPPPFLRSNLELLDEARQTEERIRRRDLAVNDESLYRFYRERLGNTNDFAGIRKLVKQNGSDDFLRLKRSDVWHREPEGDEYLRFPDQVSIEGHDFSVDYSFDPGQDRDGATIRIPVGYADILDESRLDWLIPGFFREKVETLLKGLPKQYRKQLIPLNDTVERTVREMERGEGAFIAALSRFLYTNFGVDVPAEVWENIELPLYLRPRVQVEDTKGKILYLGRNLHSMKSGAVEKAKKKNVRSIRKKWERRGITGWDSELENIPEKITTSGGGAGGIGYPALVPSGDGTVDLTVLESEDRAEELHPLGVSVLLSRYFARELKNFKGMLGVSKKNRRITQYFGGPFNIEEKLWNSIIRELFARNIRTKEAFNETAGKAASEIYPFAERAFNLLESFLETYHEVRSYIYKLEQEHRGKDYFTAFLSCIRDEMERIAPAAFPDGIPIKQIPDTGRYIRALGVRAERGILNLKKDQEKEEEIRYLENHLAKVKSSLSRQATREKGSALKDAERMLEEYRVSIFAPKIKVPVKVSSKRIMTKLHEIERMF
ncbi:MAG: ATP-dependent RNA helicase HrpA [Spirochaetia bacterium]